MEGEPQQEKQNVEVVVAEVSQEKIKQVTEVPPRQEAQIQESGPQVQNEPQAQNQPVQVETVSGKETEIYSEPQVENNREVIQQEQVEAVIQQQKIQTKEENRGQEQMETENQVQRNIPENVIEPQTVQMVNNKNSQNANFPQQQQDQGRVDNVPTFKNPNQGVEDFQEVRINNNNMGDTSVENPNYQQQNLSYPQQLNTSSSNNRSYFINENEISNDNN